MHHQTALDACRIIANNQDGFLSRNESRAGRVTLDEVLLTDDTYWYFLADESALAAYPIVNDFRAWTFPAAIPEHWGAVDVQEMPRVALSGLMSDQVKTDDNRMCVVTASGQWFRVAHMTRLMRVYLASLCTRKRSSCARRVLVVVQTSQHVKI